MVQKSVWRLLVIQPLHEETGVGDLFKLRLRAADFMIHVYHLRAYYTGFAAKEQDM